MEEEEEEKKNINGCSFSDDVTFHVEAERTEAVKVEKVKGEEAGVPKNTYTHTMFVRTQTFV